MGSGQTCTMMMHPCLCLQQVAGQCTCAAEEEQGSPELCLEPLAHKTSCPLCTHGSQGPSVHTLSTRIGPLAPLVTAEECGVSHCGLASISILQTSERRGMTRTSRPLAGSRQACPTNAASVIGNLSWLALQAFMLSACMQNADECSLESPVSRHWPTGTCPGRACGRTGRSGQDLWAPCPPRCAARLPRTPHAACRPESETSAPPVC